MSRPALTTELPTLGDVLYAGNTDALIEEGQWVVLLQAVGAGDVRAFRELFIKTHTVVFAFISRVVHDQEAADRLVVDVFYDVWRYAASHDSAVGSVIGWIMSQARSHAINHLRQSQQYEPIDDARADVVAGRTAGVDAGGVIRG